MAIFGSLENMPLTELLSLLSSKDGVLEIFNLKGGSRVTLVMSAGMLQCLLVQGREIEPVRARSLLAHLLRARRGSFEFAPGSQRPRCDYVLGWPITQVLLSTVTLHDELDQEQSVLPHPKTRFVFGMTALDRFDLDPSLADFLRAAKRHLLRGATALELSSALRIPLRYVQLHLMKLERVGVVRVAADGGAVAAKGGAGATKRLLARLRERFFSRGEGRA